MKIILSETRQIEMSQILALYQANNWSAADKPESLKNGLINSHALVSAWDKEKLVGIGNAISDGYLVVYYPHLLVLPDYKGKGIGKRIVARLQDKYKDFQMQILTADANAIGFYSKVGFKAAGETMPMWVYHGNEH